MDFFKYFPHAEYSNNSVTNLLVRTKIRDYLKNNTYIYYPYTVSDNDRPDILANNYYGNYKYTWLIFYANDIFDPARDWVLNESEFSKYLDYKYNEEDYSSPWETGIEYKEAQQVSYENKVWVCNKRHTWKGTYVSSKTYNINDVVGYLSSIWICIISNSYKTPSIDSSYWLKISDDNSAVPGYSEDFWSKISDVYPRPGFQIANETIKEFRNGKGYVVTFDSWYHEMYSSIENYDWSEFDGDKPFQISTIQDQTTIFSIKIDSVVGSGLTLIITLYNEYSENGKYITSVQISNGGSNYKVGDVVTISGGTGGQVTINSVDSIGVVTRVTLNNPGNDYTLSPTPTKETESLLNYTFTLSDVVRHLGTTFKANDISYPIVVNSGKRAVNCLQYEKELNEAKRNIKLIDNTYAAQILNELKLLLQT